MPYEQSCWWRINPSWAQHLIIGLNGGTVEPTARLGAVPANGTYADVCVWPTTAPALVDGSTKALGLAALVKENPRERPSEIPHFAEVGNRPELSEAAIQPGTGPRSCHHSPLWLS